MKLELGGGTSTIGKLSKKQPSIRKDGDNAVILTFEPEPSVGGRAHVRIEADFRERDKLYAVLERAVLAINDVGQVWSIEVSEK